MGKRKKILKNNEDIEKYNSFIRSLTAYRPEILEKSPSSPAEIYEYYSYVDSLYVWLKNAYNDDLCVLCNEMRAILGHLSEYSPSNEDKRNNLGKAYGHLRRLSIDTLKILCNGFDKEFDEWITKHTPYDYSSIDDKYLPTYITLYYKAHNMYIAAQKAENLGSDRGNNIIKKYHDAAQAYGELYSHHTNERRYAIEKTTRRFKINKCAWILSTAILAILSILGGFFIKG